MCVILQTHSSSYEARKTLSTHRIRSPLTAYVSTSRSEDSSSDANSLCIGKKGMKMSLERMGPRKLPPAPSQRLDRPAVIAPKPQEVAGRKPPEPTNGAGAKQTGDPPLSAAKRDAQPS